MTTPAIRAALERLLHDLIEGEVLDGAVAAASAALADCGRAVGEGPSLADIGDLCEEHSFNCDDGESIEILHDMITAALRAIYNLGRQHGPAAPPALPANYIDPEHHGGDLELLQTFYQACSAEGGTADEIHLRGLRAVLTARPAAPPAQGPAPDSLAEALTARRLLQEVARLDNSVEITVAEVRQLAAHAAAWVRENPPGQPVAIEPRGCPTPGACSCVVPAPQPAPAIFPVEYADADGDGIRIAMEPAEETGRACWVVRNSRHVNPCHEFSTPEAAYAAHQAAQPAQPTPPAPPAPEREGHGGGRIISIAKAVQEHAFGWEPDARLIGNVCAEDVADLCSAILARWGRPAAPPAPEAGEVGELVAVLLADAECLTADRPDLLQATNRQLTRAAELLQQLSAPAPAVAPGAMEALTRLYWWGGGAWSYGYSADVVLGVRDWINGGMAGDLPPLPAWVADRCPPLPQVGEGEA